jgi:rhodanese-related sulfurtransferase
MDGAQIAMTTARALGVVALLLGVLAAFAPDPRRAGTIGKVGADNLAAAIDGGEGEVSPLQLAAWIREHAPGLRVIDLRDEADYAGAHVPTAERQALADLAGLAAGEHTLVLYGGPDNRAAQAWVLLRLLGHARAFYLSGGIAAWDSQVLHPVLSPAALSPADFRRLADLSRYFGGLPLSGTGPNAITSVLGSRPAPATTPRRAIARIGGC